MLGAILILAIGGAPEVVGCLGTDALLERVLALKNAGFAAITPRRVASEWPRGLKQTATDSQSGSPLELTREGRIIDAVLHCGESYSFPAATQGAEAPLRAFTAVTIIESEEVARRLADSIVSVIHPPQGSEASGLISIDKTEPTDVLANYFWSSSAGRESVTIVRTLRGDERAFVLTWTRTGELAATR